MAQVAHINFDIFKLFEKLKGTGVPESQARVMLEVQQEFLEQVVDNTLVTKTDMNNLEHGVSRRFDKLDRHIDKVEMEIKFLKWSVNLLIAGVATLIFKAFF